MSKLFLYLAGVPVLKYIVAAIFLLCFHLTWRFTDKSLREGSGGTLRLGEAIEIEKIERKLK